MDPRRIAKRIRALSTPLTPLPTGLRPGLGPLPGIRAVLFDVYGTLFLSASGEPGSAAGAGPAQALQEALGACGLRPADGAGRRGQELLAEGIREAHRSRRAVGVDHPEVEMRAVLGEVLRRLAAERMVRGEAETDPQAVEELAVEYECRANPVWPMPGLAATLAALRERRLALGIVSNAQFYTPSLFPALLGQSLSRLGFRASLCAWSYRLLEAKPSPALFAGPLTALARAGVAPAEVLYLGNDRLNDLWPAGRLGLKTALVAADRRALRLREADRRLEGVKPDLTLTALDQLLEALA